MNLKTVRIFTYIGCMLMLLITKPLFAQETTEPVDQKIDQLIQPLLDSNYHISESDAALDKIRQMPHITNSLLHRLNIELAKPHPHSQTLLAIMEALIVRTDYTPEQIEAIREKTLWAFDAMKTDTDHASFFAEGNVRLFGNNPSSENEDILITALAPSLDAAPGVQENAVCALQKSGTVRAVVALEKLAKRIEPAPGHKNRLYDLVIETVPMLATRTRPSASPKLPPSPLLPSAKVPETKPTSQASSKEGSSVITLGIIIVLIATAIGMVWLQLRKSKLR